MHTIAVSLSLGDQGGMHSWEQMSTPVLVVVMGLWLKTRIYFDVFYVQQASRVFLFFLLLNIPISAHSFSQLLLRTN